MLSIRFADRRPQMNAVTIVPVFAGGLDEALAELEGEAQARAAAAAGRFTGDHGELVDVVLPDEGRLALLGLGKANELNGQRAAAAGAAVTARYLTSGVVSLVLPASDNLSPEMLAELATGARLRSWRWDRYRTTQKDKDKPSVEELVLVDAEAARPDVERLSAVADGVALARELVTEPANVIYPESFVERVRAARPSWASRSRCWVRTQMARTGHGRAVVGVRRAPRREGRLLDPALERRRGRRQAGGVRRQGRHLRHRRHFHQAVGGHGGHEVRHGRRGRRRPAP